MTQKKKPKVYITRRLPEVVETRMRELFDAELNIDDTPRSQPELVAAVKSADVLVPTLTDRIDAALIEQAGPQLKLIACFSNGVDNVDVEAAARRGIVVLSTPGANAEATAEHTIALLFALILAYYKLKGDRVPANFPYAVSDTLRVNGRRLTAGGFDQDGLHCGHCSGGAYCDVGFFLLGVERLDA